MSELSSKDAARGLSDVLSRVKFGNERIVLTRRGKPVCAIVTLGDLEHLEAHAACGASATPSAAIAKPEEV